VLGKLLDKLLLLDILVLVLDQGKLLALLLALLLVLLLEDLLLLAMGLGSGSLARSE